MTELNHAKIGGAALAVGYALVLAVLYRSPEAGLEAATASGQSALYFLLLPIAGLGAGVYAYRSGPYGTVPILILGGYLGVVGLGLTLGALLAPKTAGLALGTGIAGVACAVVALVASLAELVGGVRLEPLSASSDRIPIFRRSELREAAFVSDSRFRRRIAARDGLSPVAYQIVQTGSASVMISTSAGPS